MKKNVPDSLRDKILFGLDESFKKLLKQKKQLNQTFVWSVDGEIVHVRARDVKLKDLNAGKRKQP
jgi:hypothetical protein